MPNVILNAIAGNVVYIGFFWGFLEKGVESTFLNIPDNLRPTYFFHFFKGISSGSDTVLIQVKKIS